MAGLSNFAKSAKRRCKNRVMLLSNGGARVPSMDAAFVKDVLKAAFEIGLEVVWPTRCAVCDAPEEKVLCAECESKLRFVDMCTSCAVCGAPFGIVQCTECNDVMLAGTGLEGVPIDTMACALVMDEAARRIVSIYKDKDERRLCKVIAGYIARYVSPDRIAEGCTISYIPDSVSAFRRRGFDHGEEIAREVASICSLECIQLFARPKSSDQRELGRQARFANMRQRMKVLDMALPQKVLLVDDICTTGSTLFNAAIELKENGVQKVHAVTFARVV